MKRIICVGNRFKPNDAAGSMVHDRLKGMDLPDDVEVIDGGLAGLDLLRFMDGAERVVFVDAVIGFESEDGIVLLSAEEVADLGVEEYDHNAGLAYLLQMLPLVMVAPIPETYLVGVEGDTKKEHIAKAADISLCIAINGRIEENSVKEEMARLQE